MSDQGIVIKNPVHPGEFIRCEIVEELGLSVKRAAEVLGVSRPALSALLNERASLSPDMAIRMEKAFGVSMDTLMRMQHAYDIAQARNRASQIVVQRYVALAKSDVSDFAHSEKASKVKYEASRSDPI